MSLAANQASGVGSDQTAQAATAPSAGAVELPRVIETELKEIVKRRHVAGLDPSSQEPARSTDEVKPNLVGLSMSGEGSARPASVRGSSSPSTEQGSCATSTT
jgi:hypothetical protein